eukprot:s2246_g1.t3
MEALSIPTWFDVEGHVPHSPFQYGLHAPAAQASFESTSAPVVLNPRGGAIVSECDSPLDFSANASRGRVALVNTDRGHGCWTTRDERYFHGDYPVTLGVVRIGFESFDAFEIQPPQALASEFAASHQEMYVLLPGDASQHQLYRLEEELLIPRITVQAGDTEGFVPTGKKVQSLTAAEVWVVLPADRLPPAPTRRVMSGNELTECDVGSGGDLPEADTFGDIALVTMTGQSDTCWNWDDYTNRGYVLERGRVTGSDGLVYEAFRVSPPNQTAKSFVASRINLYIRQNVTQITTVWALQASGFHPVVTVDVQAGNFSQTSITVDDLGTRLDDLRGALVLILQPSSAHLTIWPREGAVEAGWLDGAIDGGFSFTGRRFAVPGQPFLPQRHWAHGLDSSKTVYGDYKHFTPVRHADGREGIVWQDMDSGTVKLTWLSVDLLTSQTVSLTVLSATGLLVGAVGDGRGTVVILLGDSSQPSDLTANTPGELVKFDAAGNELQRVALPELGLWSFFDSGASMAWLATSDTISLTLAMKWVDYGATNVIFNATTLQKLRTASAGSHSWANSLKLSEKDGSKDDYYLGMILGDAFPRGIMISEYRASSDDKRGRVIYYPKTVHRTTATNPKGQVLPVYQEISTATETYYQWSKNLRGNLGFVRIPRDLTSREVLSPGDVENGGFFDEDGQWQNLTNRGVSFLTSRTDMDESLSRVKTAELNGSILLFWEVWSGELYKRNEFMVVNAAGELEHAETALQFPFQLPFADDILVINGKAVAYTGDPGSWLVRYEFCYQNCDPPRSPNDASSATSTASTTPSTGSGSGTTSVDSSTTSVDGSTMSMNSPGSSTTSTDSDAREASAALSTCKNLVALQAALAPLSSYAPAALSEHLSIDFSLHHGQWQNFKAKDKTSWARASLEVALQGLFSRPSRGSGRLIVIHWSRRKDLQLTLLVITARHDLRASPELPMLLNMYHSLKPAAGDCPSWGKPFPSNLAGLDKISFANLYEVTYYDQYKVVEYTASGRPYDGQWHPEASVRGTRVPPMVLYQCGTTKPTTDMPGVPSNARFFEIPVKNVTVGWGGPLAFIELLGVSQSIDLVDISAISSPCMQLLEVCYPETHIPESLPDWSANPEWMTRASRTDVVFTDTFGSGRGGDAAKDVPFEISFDPGSLSRAEWIKFMAFFYNEEEQAEQVFEQIKADYNALKAIGDRLRTDASTEWKGEQPKVMFVSQSGSRNAITNAAYKTQFITDAGAQLVQLPAMAPAGCSFTDNTDGSKMMRCDIPAGDAAFTSFLAEADVIIDESSLWPDYDPAKYRGFGTIYNVTADQVPALARSPPNIFRVDGQVSDPFGEGSSVGSSWFDIQQSEPQQFLAGLMEAIWDTDFASTCGQKYLWRVSDLNAQNVVGHQDCPLHSAGQNDCQSLHDRLHTPPICSGTTTTVQSQEASAAHAVGGPLALAALLFAAACIDNHQGHCVRALRNQVVAGMATGPPDWFWALLRL